MGAETPLLEVGHVAKPHGVNGAVVVALVTNRLERIRPGTVLFGTTPDGGHLELEIESSSPHLGRFIVQFAGYNSMDSAQALRGVVLSAAALDDDDALFVHDLIGSAVFDQDGVERGTVVSVEANPASDLLVLDTKSYVPLRFIVSRSTGRIDVDTPNGLFD